MPTLPPNLDAVAYARLFILVSVLAVAAELFISIALWLPSLRRAAFGVGLGLHLSMIVLITHAPQLAFRLGIFAFLTPSVIYCSSNRSRERGWLSWMTVFLVLHVDHLVQTPRLAKRLPLLGLRDVDACGRKGHADMP
jgi:hypothetical protein